MILPGLLLLFTSWHDSNGCVITPPNPNGHLCKGETYTFLVNANPGDWVSWTSSSPTTVQIIQTAIGTAQVICMQSGSFTIGVVVTNSTGSSSCNIPITVFEVPNPVILSNSQVACQAFQTTPDGSGLPVIYEAPCQRVCKNSQVLYTANGLSGSSFQWTVTGGAFFPGGGNTTTGNPVTVNWDNAVGTGYIEVLEAGLGDCSQSEKICIERIETPEANFISGLNFNGTCYNACLHQTINFLDLSIPNVATSGSYVSTLSWQWDFGDGSPHSSLQNPTHVYNTPGTYDVTLTVTNVCNCSSSYSICVEVLSTPGLSIYCNEVSCQNHVELYHTDALCTDYQWEVIGGDFVLGGAIVPGAAITTTSPYIHVLWNLNNSSLFLPTSGFGQLKVTGSGCSGICEEPVSTLVPVIYTEALGGGNFYSACVREPFRVYAPAWPATDFVWSLTEYTTMTPANQMLTSQALNSNMAEASFTAPGLYEFKGEYTNSLTGCIGALYWKVQVTEKPLLEAPKKICASSGMAPFNCQLQFNSPISLSQTVQWKFTSPTGAILVLTSLPPSGAITTLPLVVNAPSFFSTPGIYVLTVTSSGSSSPDFCEPDMVMLLSVAPPPAAASISGETLVCPGVDYPFQAIVSTPNTGCIWSAPGGVVVGNGTSALAQFNTFPTTLSAFSYWADIPACTSSTATSLTIQKLEALPTINTPTSICEDGTDNYTVSLAGGVVPDIIEWSLLSPDLGSIVSGQGTTTISVNWNHLPGSTSSVCLLKCRVFKCGIAHSHTIPVTILKSVSIQNVIPVNPTVCSGVPLNITAHCLTTASMPTQYTWHWGDGSTSVSTVSAYNNSNSHVYTNTSNNSQVFNGTVEVLSNCNNISASMPFTVTVHPQPNAALSYTGLLNVCQPNLASGVLLPYSTVFAVANTSLTGSPFTYQWEFDQLGASWGNTLVTGATGTSLAVTDVALNTSLGTTTTPEHNQGEYRCVINNSFGCPITVGPLSVSYIHCNPVGGGGGCVPTTPYGISNYQVQIINCATLSATCNTSGTIGVNLNNFNWILTPPAGAVYTTSGTQTQNQSYNYLVDKAGIYHITLELDYVSSGGSGSCYLSQDADVIVPLVPDLKFVIVCNGSNSGYNLTLTDNSSVYPAGTATTANWYLDGTYQGSGTNYTVNNISAGSHTVYLVASIGSGIGQTCTSAVITFVAPSLPVASFTISSTDPLSTPASPSSCEDRPIQFTSTSTPMANIISHSWDFNDGSNSMMINPGKVFDQFNPSQTIKLTVIDNFGCQSQPFSLIMDIVGNMNYISSPPLTTPYNPIAQSLCYNQATSILLNGFSGGYAPLQFQWYQQTSEVIPPQNSTTLSPPLNVNGLYWVSISDAHGCKLNVQPPLCKVTYKPAPIASISGPQHVCMPHKVKLHADCGVNTGITYTWLIQPGSISVTGQDLNYYLPSGVYQISVSVYDANTGCSSVSLPYPITVHPSPAIPTVSYNMVDCNTYLVALNASPTLSAPAQYNWSHGTSGSPAYTHEGGIYRCWVTDTWGCKSYNDLEVPLSPESYFWRFPKGCARYCEEELPKTINPPYDVVFNAWAYHENGSPMTSNGPFAPSGIFSTSDPFWVGPGSSGLSSNTYQWALANSVCNKISEPWQVDVQSCCKVQGSADVLCYSSPVFLYDYLVSLDFMYLSAGTCATGNFNITFVDANNNPLPGFYASTPFPFNSITAGAWTNAQIQCSTNLSVYQGTTIYALIKVICNEETCVGLIPIHLPICASAKLTNVDTIFRTANQSERVLSIYPNPAGSYIHMAFALEEGELELVISDMMGKTILQDALEGTQGKYTLQHIEWASGIYVASIRRRGQRLISQRFTIHHP